MTTDCPCGFHMCLRLCARRNRSDGRYLELEKKSRLSNTKKSEYLEKINE